MASAANGNRIAEGIGGLAFIAIVIFLARYSAPADSAVDIRDAAAIAKLHHDDELTTSAPVKMCRYQVRITLECEMVPAGSSLIFYQPAFLWEKSDSTDGDGKIEGRYAFLRSPFKPYGDNIWLAE